MKVGKISESVLKRSVLRQLHADRNEVIKGAGVGEDCAFFVPSGEEYIVTCMQEGTLGEWEGGMGTMTHLMERCVNNLAVSGAEPFMALITLILPKETEEPSIKEWMKEADQVCKKYGMQIAGGQTRITSAVSSPLAVVTGYGRLFEKRFRPGNALAGQDIVLSKWIGLEGTASLAKTNRDSLLGRYPAYLVDEAAGFDRYLSIVPEAATAVESGACALHDASEGGIFGAIWELAEKAGVGLTIDLKKIPLRQETVEVCEHLGVNPYELRSGGCLVMTAADGEALKAALELKGIPATVIGKITDSNDRLILNEDEVRYMDRPKQDGIYLCQD